MLLQRRQILAGLGAIVLAEPAHAQATRAAALVAAARSQIGRTLHYDARYVRLPYPGGDLPIERGVCTDVVIRALRVIGIDLQREVHEDRRRAASAYPKQWSSAAPDASIDHRRVPNLMVYFARRHHALREGVTVEPADIIAWRLPGGAQHIGVISDRRVADRLLVIHNIGDGTQEEDILMIFPRIGHYRIAL
mgnify:CR=1 FL=1